LSVLDCASAGTDIDSPSNTAPTAIV
jgi:hypothetical protein